VSCKTTERHYVADPGHLGGLNSGDGILDHDALARREPNILCGCQVYIGRGLSGTNAVIVYNFRHVEPSVQAKMLYEELKVRDF
jgi:hypothetical protein